MNLIEIKNQWQPETKEKPEVVIRRNKNHFDSYTKANRFSFSPNGLARKAAEHALVVAVNELGIEKKYGEDVAFGLALVVGDGMFRHSVSAQVPGITPDKNPEKFRTQFKNETAKQIKKVSKWLPHEFKELPSHKTPKEYQTILTQAEKDWPRE